MKINYRILTGLLLAFYSIFSLTYHLPDFYDLIILVFGGIPWFMYNYYVGFVVHFVLGFLLSFLFIRRNKK